MADTTRTPDAHREPIAFDDRTRRVMELRKQIQDGTYRRSDEVIAEAILREWIEVGASLTCKEANQPAELPSNQMSLASRFVVERSAGAVSSDPAVRSA